MAKLFIPACGDRLTLTAPWEFTLYLESRNMKFAEARGLYKPGKGDSWGAYDRSHNLKKVQASLPAGTVLECDRVYIRTQNKSRLKADGDANEIDYDSIMWKVMQGEKMARNQRFWCKLSDACEIEYDLAVDSFYRDRVKAVKIVMES
jgi:hypothetical protein